jgi:hypothetical protein
MIELPNSEAQAKAALYAAMRRGTDPRWELPIEEVKPSRINWLIWPAILVSAAVSVGMFWG